MKQVVILKQAVLLLQLHLVIPALIELVPLQPLFLTCLLVTSRLFLQLLPGDQMVLLEQVPLLLLD
jgi:hypothetical protein